MSDRSPSRRAVLAACLSTASAGCVGPLSNGPDCTLTLHERYDTDDITMDLGYTSNNAAEGGDCNRWTATVCFQAEIWFDRSLYERIQVETPSGEVLDTWRGDDTPDRATEGSTDAPTETEPIATPPIELDEEVERLDESRSVYFQLGVLEDGDTVTRVITFYRRDGETNRGRFTLSC